jgi:divalent metal cation (Fe/Co/Zn/Cd) transporter
MHVLVPGAWSVQRGHDVVEAIEERVREAVAGASVFTHLEPREDPASYQDETLDRKAG